MGQTLLDKAEQNLNIAKLLMESFAMDEAYLNYAGYHLQQAVEFTLKHCISTAGAGYPRSHDIDNLMHTVRNNNVFLLHSDFIDDHGERFTLWELNTRCILDYRITQSKLEHSMKEVSDFVEFNRIGQTLLISGVSQKEIQRWQKNFGTPEGILSAYAQNYYADEAMAKLCDRYGILCDRYGVLYEMEQELKEEETKFSEPDGFPF